MIFRNAALLVYLPLACLVTGLQCARLGDQGSGHGEDEATSRSHGRLPGKNVLKRMLGREDSKVRPSSGNCEDDKRILTEELDRVSEDLKAMVNDAHHELAEKEKKIADLQQKLDQSRREAHEASARADAASREAEEAKAQADAAAAAAREAESAAAAKVAAAHKALAARSGGASEEDAGASEEDAGASEEDVVRQPTLANPRAFVQADTQTSCDCCHLCGRVETGSELTDDGTRKSGPYAGPTHGRDLEADLRALLSGATTMSAVRSELDDYVNDVDRSSKQTPDGAEPEESQPEGPPKLTDKQKRDLKRVQEGIETLEQMKERLQQSRPFGPKGMSPEDADAYVKAIEANLQASEGQGGAGENSQAKPAAGPPKLTDKQKRDLKRVQEGIETLEQMKERLQQSRPFGPKGMTPEAASEYVEAIRAHLGKASSLLGVLQRVRRTRRSRSRRRGLPALNAAQRADLELLKGRTITLEAIEEDLEEYAAQLETRFHEEVPKHGRDLDEDMTNVKAATLSVEKVREEQQAYADAIERHLGAARSSLLEMTSTYEGSVFRRGSGWQYTGGGPFVPEVFRAGDIDPDEGSFAAYHVQRNQERRMKPKSPQPSRQPPPQTRRMKPKSPQPSRQPPPQTRSTFPEVGEDEAKRCLATLKRYAHFQKRGHHGQRAPTPRSLVDLTTEAPDEEPDGSSIPDEKGGSDDDDESEQDDLKADEEDDDEKEELSGALEDDEKDLDEAPVEEQKGSMTGGGPKPRGFEFEGDMFYDAKQGDEEHPFPEPASSPPRRKRKNGRAGPDFEKEVRRVTAAKKREDEASTRPKGGGPSAFAEKKLGLTNALGNLQKGARSGNAAAKGAGANEAAVKQQGGGAPKLTDKQKRDLKRVQEGIETLEQMKERLQQSRPFGPKGMTAEEADEYTKAIEAHLEASEGETAGGSQGATGGGAPKLTDKQKRDLKRVQEGIETLEQMKERLQMSRPFGPKGMTAEEADEYTKAIEAHLEARRSSFLDRTDRSESNDDDVGDEDTSPSLMQAAEMQDMDAYLNNTMELSPAQEEDLKLLKAKAISIEQIQKEQNLYAEALEFKIGRTRPDGTRPDSKQAEDQETLDEDDDLELELETEPGTTTTTTTTKKKPKWIRQVSEEIEHTKLLLQGTPAAAAFRSMEILSAKVLISDYLDLDRDKHLKVQVEKKEKKQDTTAKKPEFDFPFMDTRALGWTIQLKFLKEHQEKMGLTSPAAVLKKLASGEALGGDFDGERPKALEIVKQYMGNLKDEELEVVDFTLEGFKAEPTEFEKQYSGYSEVSSFIKDIAEFKVEVQIAGTNRTKKLKLQPKPTIECLFSGYDLAASMQDIKAGLPPLQTYYSSTAASQLIDVIDTLVSEAHAVVLRLIQSDAFLEKQAAVQTEYRYIDRQCRDKANAAKFRTSWAASDRSQGIAPLMLALNILMDKDAKIAGRYKKRDDGKWSPEYLDLFLLYGKEAKKEGTDDTYTTLIGNACQAVRDIEVEGKNGVGGYLEMMDYNKKQVKKCTSVTRKAAPVMQDAWGKLSNTSEEVMTELEALRLKARAVAGPVMANLRTGDGDAKWKAIDEATQKYVKKNMDTEDSGTLKKYPPEAFFDDFTLRTNLLKFCERVNERVPKLDEFYSLRNEPPLPAPQQ
eukprot:TRINITY_DN4325_c0_g1_i9.p1 TRINITY_DN4325_c0_g1~~TRINITY_DN4325_c0_g1_i9.p1  ORF type:complete len:1648 (-),score=488.29 TRINITY_DN4325_c0_g1_i9:145-5088(-)